MVEDALETSITQAGKAEGGEEAERNGGGGQKGVGQGKENKVAQEHAVGMEKGVAVQHSAPLTTTPGGGPPGGLVSSSSLFLRLAGRQGWLMTMFDGKQVVSRIDGTPTIEHGAFKYKVTVSRWVKCRGLVLGLDSP